MIRTPELKKQAAMLALEIQAAMNAPLKRADALEIVAKLNGFKNWRHAVSATQAGPEVSVAPASTPALPVELEVIFGSEDSSSFEKGHDPETLDNYYLKKFATEGEKAAYLEGINDMDGWAAYTVVENPLKQFFAEFAPGEDATAIRAELTKMGFTRVAGAMRGADEEFNRDILDPANGEEALDPASGEEALAFQFIIFQRDEASGMRFVNMDCALCSNGDYLTETPLFTGATVLETLKSALKKADAQRDEALREFQSMSESAQ